MPQSVFDEKILMPETNSGLRCKEQMGTLLLEFDGRVGYASSGNEIGPPSFVNRDVIFYPDIETCIGAVRASIDVGSPWLGKN
ncbi:MAG TPA: hypothetical protein VLX12_10115 [Syntrophorhabdales bacterium]|nr:hypothetical protein [Syntrophorhabdales bacterium]